LETQPVQQLHPSYAPQAIGSRLANSTDVFAGTEIWHWRKGFSTNQQNTT
jgi:hypothetical protein